MTVCQQVPPDYQEKITNFGEFTKRKRVEYSIGPDQIINMDEVPLTFDLPLTKTVNKKGESSITLRTTGTREQILLVFLAAQHLD